MLFYFIIFYVMFYICKSMEECWEVSGSKREVTAAVRQWCKRMSSCKTPWFLPQMAAGGPGAPKTSASRAVGGCSTPPPCDLSATDNYLNPTHFSVSTCRWLLIPRLSKEYCDATEIPLRHNLQHRRGLLTYKIVRLYDLNRDINNSSLESNLTNLKEQI